MIRAKIHAGSHYHFYTFVTIYKFFLSSRVILILAVLKSESNLVTKDLFMSRDRNAITPLDSRWSRGHNGDF